MIDACRLINRNPRLLRAPQAVPDAAPEAAAAGTPQEPETVTGGERSGRRGTAEHFQF